MKRTLCLLCLCLPLVGLAQPLTLVWHRIAGGGVTGGGPLQGTIGQGEASGGGGALTAGFWNEVSGDQVVVPGTVITLASSENPSARGDPVGFTATLLTVGGVATDATGAVQFLTNGIAVGAAVGLSLGQATLVLPTLPAGNNAVTAEYAGDPNDAAASAVLYQVVTNHLPVAGTYSVLRTAGLALHIFWANVAANWSDQYGYPVTLAGLNYVTTNGVTVLANSTQILYPANAPNVSDQISYTITDGHANTNGGVINILVNPFVTGQLSPQITVSNGVTSATFYGIPGFVYEVQRATNLVFNPDWMTIATNTVGTNGLMNIKDNFFDLGGQTPVSAYYRLVWQP